MKYSNKALLVLVSQKIGLIKSNTDFQKRFKEFDDLKKELLIYLDRGFEQYIEQFKENINDLTELDGFTCFYDDDFPVINSNARNSEIPYLLFYKGNIELLSNLNNNVTVVGTTNPDDDVRDREVKIVNTLVDRNIVIVSGLALGCDTIAHKTTVSNNKPTIAILPSTLKKISPSSNKNLADEIIKSNGLLVTEYFFEAKNKFEIIKRYIERDRLQSLFSKAIILISSYREGEGDSGSRHSMNYAKKYQINRYVMYNKMTDSEKKYFALNKDLIESDYTDVEIISKKTLDNIINLENQYLNNRNDKSYNNNDVNLFNSL